MATSDTTLLVRHLPGELTPLEKEGLLRHFQATRVRVMSDTGRLKNCAFATFDDEESAKKALQRLHQLKVLGSVLVVEFARSADQSHFPKLPPPPTSLGKGPAEKASEKELPPPVVEQWKPPQDEILKKHGIEYPRNPNLHYLYPSPTVSILTNIANALASHHRFYVQVLHLMNKLNLPAPFGPATPTPPIPSGHVGSEITESDNLVMEEMDVSTSEESEIDSDGESRPSTLQPVVKRRIRSNPNKIHKRRKLVLPFSQEKSVPRTGGVVCPSDVFEQPEQQQQTKKIQLNLPSNVMAEVTEAMSSETGQSAPVTVEPESVEDDAKESEAVSQSGFGKIEPVPQTEEVMEDTEPGELVVDKSRFVSSDKLKRGRISSEEMKTSSLFKNYQPGEPTTRLYIKNLSKQTTEEDLLYIFGKYVDLECEEVKSMWDIRLMKEGRMKGQAFITYPAEKPAVRAVRDVNGYVLHGKPMVVQFARSAKPKAQEDSNKKR